MTDNAVALPKFLTMNPIIGDKIEGISHRDKVNVANAPCDGSDRFCTASGPVVLPKLYDGRNRTFWTFSYEGIYRSQVQLGGLSTMPTMAQRGGDFSSLLPLGAVHQIYDPATTAAAPGGHFSRSTFPVIVIPTARTDRPAQSLP